MINLGRKNDMETAMSSKEIKNKIHYPSFHISGIDLELGEEDAGKN